MLLHNFGRNQILYQQKAVWLIFVACLICSCSSSSRVTGNSMEKNDIPVEKEVSAVLDPYRYILGPGDEISISVWRNDDLKRSVQVDPSGNIQFPLVGEIQASGMTISRLREEMTERLSKYIVNPQVDIAVSNLSNARVYVLGEVKSPGMFDWRNGMSVWEGISQAGGFTTDADTRNVLLLRGQKSAASLRKLDFEGVFAGKSSNESLYLANGEIIYVLPSTIANVERFMNRMFNILAPIISLESSIVLYPQARDVLQGKEVNETIVVPR